MDIRKVKKLIELLEESDIHEIEIKEGEESVRISRASSVAAPVAAVDDSSDAVMADGESASVDGQLICPKACCGKRYGGNQAKNHLSDHLHKVCIPRNGALTPREKDVHRRYDMAECSKCHRWFTRRNRWCAAHAAKFIARG